ncbi:BTAD domain-containing putative transcriptional regulator [Actinomadura syzygii]|uniref:AfsR/SARP family transcriptional regulator n=1 Tax=Actinomadura syzygii TaxID=1427538 RepID=A0A5D0TVX1_9ACTN|nr:AfsR/SARP family transcriptional regulator [Actinomadura syzygii]TYC10318.1 AfsR/SARP family transcriptional regulator [Actinomadura syzygii]
MRYEILGSLRVVDEEKTLVINARKMEVLLTTLLIRAGEVVSLDQLVTEIWNHNPPKRATDALYVYIYQLRKLLTRPGRAETPIVTRAPGYVLCPRDHEFDFWQFQQLVNEGRDAARANRPEQAATALGAALDLCRGPILPELRDGPIIAGFVTWLEELRLECTEWFVESNLALGRHREMVRFLYGLVGEQPLHEAFYRQLMQALYHSERRADALKVYQMARKTLQDELGLEPGRALRELQQRILLADEPYGEHAAAG